MESVFSNGEDADLDPRQKAILNFATKLSKCPSEAGKADVELLVENGLDMDEILDLVLSTSLFGWANRTLLLGLRAELQIHELLSKVDVSRAQDQVVRCVEQYGLALGHAFMDAEAQDKAVQVGIALTRRLREQPADRMARRQTQKAGADLTLLDGQIEVALDRRNQRSG